MNINQAHSLFVDVLRAKRWPSAITLGTKEIQIPQDSKDWDNQSLVRAFDERDKKGKLVAAFLQAAAKLLQS